jgi:lactate dehydrogenase-like 2-hydroxyacid dehydrogenase
VKIAKKAGWSDVQFTNCTTEIKLALQGLLNKIKTLIESNTYKGINLRLLQTQRLALSHRIGQIDRGVFKWGILSARKPYDVVFITQPPVTPDYHPMMKYSTEDIDGNLKFGTNVVVLTIKDGMPREKIAELPSTTQLIVTMSAGLDHVDREAAAERGIKVARAAREQLVKSVADYTVSSLVFGLRDGFRNIGVPFPGAKDWNLSWNSDGMDLDRSKIGFIGIGKIVEETCRRIRALSSECELVYHVPEGIRSSFEGGTFRMFHVGFADLLSTCDAVVVLCPLTASTSGLVGYKEFSMMKKSAVFVNMARGKIVDTEGMFRALQENLIRHAILDTTGKFSSAQQSAEAGGAVNKFAHYWC